MASIHSQGHISRFGGHLEQKGEKILLTIVSIVPKLIRGSGIKGNVFSTGIGVALWR
jgi:hypothetical protein